MMIWKQRAKLVVATARWVLKHPFYGIVILRLGIYASYDHNMPTFEVFLPFSFFFLKNDVSIGEGEYADEIFS